MTVVIQKDFHYSSAPFVGYGSAIYLISLLDNTFSGVTHCLINNAEATMGRGLGPSAMDKLNLEISDPVFWCAETFNIIAPTAQTSGQEGQQGTPVKLIEIFFHSLKPCIHAYLPLTQYSPLVKSGVNIVCMWATMEGDTHCNCESNQRISGNDMGRSGFF